MGLFSFFKRKRQSQVTNSEAHDAWFRAKVQEALQDLRPDIPDDRAEAHFAARRAAARRKADAGS